MTLYSRAYCHLCQDMLAALDVLRGEFSFVVDVLDVDADPHLLSRYDEFVPVLEAEGSELCHYFLDESVVRQYLQGSANQCEADEFPTDWADLTILWK